MPDLVNPDGTTRDPNGFTRWIHEYPRDALDRDLSARLAECIEATQLHGKKSTLTLTVTILPGKGYYGELEVKAKTKADPAEPDTPVATFFATADGSLSRSDPNQASLFDPTDKPAG